MEMLLFILDFVLFALCTVLLGWTKYKRAGAVVGVCWVVVFVLLLWEVS